MLHSAAHQPARTIGRYALFAEIASGGMATVHIGRLLGPVGFSRTVAIKRLHAQFARDPEFVTMFLDEARLAARIRHPNVIPTLDVVATHGELFLVLEYVQGESLTQLTKAAFASPGHIPLDIIRSIMSGALHGLHAAHEARSESGEPLGIVHRDVSPQNILVGVDGVARVLDFGIAKAAGRAHVTRDQSVKGKLSYMTPEQIQNKSPVDRRVDVYAAATVLWELLTGQRLFRGDTDSSTLAHILTGAVDPPSAVVPGIPAAFDRIVMRGVQRDPAQRYSTTREMALELEASGPLAPPSVVGAWVETIASAALAKRARHIAEVEQVRDIPPPMMSSRPPAGLAPSAGHDDPTVVKPRAESGLTPSGFFEFTTLPPAESTFEALEESAALPAVNHRRRRILAGVSAVLLLAVLLLGAGLIQRSRTASASAATVPVAPAAVSHSQEPAQPVSSEPLRNSPTENMPIAATTTAQENPPILEVTPAAEIRAVKPRAKAPMASAAASSRPPHAKPTGSDCNPPYTVDSVGTRHYKMECL